MDFLIIISNANHVIGALLFVFFTLLTLIFCLAVMYGVDSQSNALIL